jgi:hypothetical protein
MSTNISPMKRLKVTIKYNDGHINVIEADHLITEAVQWRLDIDEDILLVPMIGVQSVLMEHRK